MAEVESSYRALPKAELHLHLEGSLSVRTFKELAPGLSEEEIRRRWRPSGDFAGFIEAFTWGLGFLRKPEDYALAARRLLEQLAAENVCYAEITISGGAVVRRGRDFRAIFEALAAEAAASPVEVRWILDAIRQFGPAQAEQVAELAAAYARRGVVAFGLGGDEAAGPASWFREICAWVRGCGLHLSIHAGETAGPESIWEALQAGAERIGHGVRAEEDPALVAWLRDHDIALEICLSSNLATGAVKSLAAHPLRRLYEAGVPVVLNTDDPGLFETTLTREYELAAEVLGFSPWELAGLAANGFRYAFDRIKPPPVAPAGECA